MQAVACEIGATTRFSTELAWTMINHQPWPKCSTQRIEFTNVTHWYTCKCCQLAIAVCYIEAGETCCTAPTCEWYDTWSHARRRSCQQICWPCRVLKYDRGILFLTIEPEKGQTRLHQVQNIRGAGAMLVIISGARVSTVTSRIPMLPTVSSPT